MSFQADMVSAITNSLTNNKNMEDAVISTAMEMLDCMDFDVETAVDILDDCARKVLDQSTINDILDEFEVKEQCLSIIDEWRKRT